MVPNTFFFWLHYEHFKHMLSQYFLNHNYHSSHHFENQYLNSLTKQPLDLLYGGFILVINKFKVPIIMWHENEKWQIT